MPSSREPVSVWSWACRCEFPDGRIEITHWATEAEANQTAEAAEVHGAVCLVLRPAAEALKADGLVPTRRFRDGWLWQRVTRH
jgi:hypothetical protein